MSERILDFEKAHEVAAGVPLYEHSDAYCAALEAQAQAAVDNAMALRPGDMYENFRQARFRYESAEAKLAEVREVIRSGSKSPNLWAGALVRIERIVNDGR